MSHRTRRLLLLAIWVIPIAGVVWWATKQEAPTFPSSFGGIMALVGALGLYVVATLMRAERWDRILRRSGVQAKRADVYALVPVGYMGNNVLPARGGELL
ncbi:MAG TPA: lysylphosphatidylglycerol synthase domain-containing protein, partial [Conexibacter sp.]|nr:lysylphosphatidylglycerol synthase domain-containing protein [Conexibacter sp.]